ncbi:MAG TPA: hypothetical protein VKT83_06105 [bacterium]|nr:hypothetical protein [bacterium]
MKAWTLDDTDSYFKFLCAKIPYAHTWGGSDREKREEIRRAVAPSFPLNIPPARWWALRLYTRKRGDDWDIENIPKLVVDAFSKDQIGKDRSAYPEVGLFAYDTIDYVRIVQVAGEPRSDEDSTIVEIFGAKP